MIIILVYIFGIFVWGIYSAIYESKDDLPPCSLSFAWPILLFGLIVSLVVYVPYLLCGYVFNMGKKL